jgi:hypothetical protein
MGKIHTPNTENNGPKEHVRLCRARLYKIEKWINDGKSLEIPAVITVFLQMVRPRPVILRSGLYPAAHVHLWPAIDTA